MQGNALNGGKNAVTTATRIIHESQESIMEEERYSSYGFDARKLDGAISPGSHSMHVNHLPLLAKRKASLEKEQPINQL